MCIFLGQKLVGGSKIEKIDMPGGPNAKMPNLFFHVYHDSKKVRRQRYRQIQKKYNTLLKRGILLTHRNFPEKPRPKRGGEKKRKNKKEREKKKSSWGAPGVGMRVHFFNINKKR